MDDKARAKKHNQIAKAAYVLLAEKGYAGTSMLSVAKAAKASNETLYRWYGDKAGLMRAMVQDNAERSRQLLEDAIAVQDSPEAVLRRVAPVLLGAVLDDRAVLLNRAAAGDPSGELGRTIATHGRDRIAPLVARVIAGLDTNAPADPTDLFLSLLIGDRQIRRCIGTLPAPTPEDTAAQAARAVDQFLTLCARDA